MHGLTLQLAIVINAAKCAFASLFLMTVFLHCHPRPNFKKQKMPIYLQVHRNLKLETNHLLDNHHFLFLSTVNPILNVSFWLKPVIHQMLYPELVVLSCNF